MAMQGNENLTIRLWDAEGNVLVWGNGADNVTTVTAVVGESCQTSEPCPQVPPPVPNKDVEFDLVAPTGKAICIALSVTYGGSNEAQELPPIMTTLECGGDAPTIDVITPAEPVEPDQEETATLLIRGHMCKRNGCETVEHTRSVAIEQVTVTPIPQIVNGALVPPDKNAPAPQVIKKEGVAFVTVVVGNSYSIDVRSKDKCDQTCCGSPVNYLVGKAGDLTLDVCFEPQERVVALFFVDSCGQPSTPTDVYNLDDGEPVTIDQNGRAQLPAQGHLRLASLAYDLRPSELHLEDGSAAHVIHTKQIATSKALKAGAEPCVFSFDNLARNSVALLKVTNAKGELQATLQPDAQGQVSYTPKDPNEILRYSAYIDGKLHETVKMKAAN